MCKFVDTYVGATTNNRSVSCDAHEGQKLLVRGVRWVGVVTVGLNE